MVPGEGGVDGPVADDVGGRVVVVEQRAVGHHDLHLDVDVGSGGLSREALDKGVGHDLAPRAGVTLASRGLCGLLEGGEAGDALLNGKEAGEVAIVSGAGRRLT